LLNIIQSGDGDCVKNIRLTAETGSGQSLNDDRQPSSPGTQKRFFLFGLSVSVAISDDMLSYF
jgi:hypothetical protein